VDVTADPGAQDFNIYVAGNTTCTGLTYCAHTGGNSNVTIPSCPSGQPSPPDGEGLPVVAGLPNADPPSGSPPRGDLANNGHCVDPTTGVNVACPSAWTVGAVQLFIPGGGNASTCLNLQAGGDIYLYSGYQ